MSTRKAGQVFETNKQTNKSPSAESCQAERSHQAQEIFRAAIVRCWGSDEGKYHMLALFFSLELYLWPLLGYHTGLADWSEPAQLLRFRIIKK